MGQKLRFECDDALTTKQTGGALSLAWRFPNEDIRVSSDPTNTKVYVGPYYKEKYRFWIDSEGEMNLVEKDETVDEDEGTWEASSLLHATLDLKSEKIV